jgi:hypothetical protein
MKRIYDRTVSFKSTLEPEFENATSGSELNRPFRLNIIRTILALKNPSKVIFDLKKEHPKTLSKK